MVQVLVHGSYHTKSACIKVIRDISVIVNGEIPCMQLSQTSVEATARDCVHSQATKQQLFFLFLLFLNIQTGRGKGIHISHNNM